MLLAIVAFCLDVGIARGQWDPEQRISIGSREVWWGGIAASGNLVHVIWGASPIRYRRSSDEGANWDADADLAADGRPHLTDPILADGENVHVVYLRNIRAVTDWCCRREIGDIFLRRSIDGGLTWLPEQRLTTAGGAHRISLAVSGQLVHMTWSDSRRRGAIPEVYYRRSPDGGATWEPEVLLVPAAAGSIGIGRPQITVVGASVHVVWGDDRDGNPRCYTVPICPETYYKRSTDGGASWEPDVRLTVGGIRFAGRPEIAAVSPSTIIVNYNQDVVAGDGGRLYIMRSTDNGDTWEPEVQLTDAPSDHGSMIGSDASFHLAWQDDRDHGNREIYYRGSPDGGESWAAEERVSNAPGASVAPLLTAGNAYLHVLWGDERTGSMQIWYRRRRLGTR